MVKNIDRKSSIESEPRTLKIDQIKFAREAALYVLHTNTMEDARCIFTKGLEPLTSVVGLRKGTSWINSSDDQLKLDEDNHELFRDIVTAPF